MTTMDNLKETDKFLEMQNPSRLNHRETQNLNRPRPSKESKPVITNLLTKESSEPDAFTGKF